MDDPCLQILNYFCDFRVTKLCNLVKRHNNNQHKVGDLSFPINGNIWHRSLKSESICLQQDHKNIFVCKFGSASNTDEEFQKLISASTKWTCPIREMKLVEDRCVVFLDRLTVTKNLMTFVLNPEKEASKPETDNIPIFLSPILETDKNTPSLSDHRLHLVRNVIENLLKNSQNYEMVGSPTGNSVTVKCFTAGKKQFCDECVNIPVGVVVDSQENKVTKMTLEEYTSLRQRDMQLMAMHKYGLRARDDKVFQDLINKLGDCAVLIDLLEVRHSSPATLKRNGQGCSKGASFILYNSARIETILRTFNRHVLDNVYPDLPPLSDVDFSLLKEEEEWQLLFNYVMTYRSYLDRAIKDIEKGICAPHLIPQFLSGFVGLISVYYRRVRILLENRSHLVPLVNVRIYFIKCLREVLNHMMRILNIEPVQRM